MSRIHDALKRAERERVRAAKSTSGTSGSAVPRSPAMMRLEDIPESPDNSAAVADPRTQQIPDDLTLATLRAQCAVSEWSPDHSRIVALHSGDTRFGGEELDSLRSRLYQSRNTHPLRRVLVSSLLPQEGKTHVAVNLAYSIVHECERRVLLVDADLRWSQLHTLLGTNLSPGLSEYLRGEADEVSVVQRGALPNLFFIPGGREASDAAELIANGRLRILLDRLSPHFDWIILDSPPAVGVPDASLLAEVCDGVLVVAAFAKILFDMTQKTRELFKTVRLLGIVLNRVEPQTAESTD